MRQGPVDHRADVFHRVRPGDIDLPGRIPEPARGVTDHHVAVAGQLGGAAEIFQIGQRPTGRHHDQRKRPCTLPLRHQYQCPHLRTVPAGDAFIGLAEGARHRRRRRHPQRQCGDAPDPTLAHAVLSHARPGRGGPAATAMHPLFGGERRERTRRYGMDQEPRAESREPGIGKLNQEQRAASLRSCLTAGWLVALVQQARARHASEGSPRGWLIATRGLLRAAQRFPRPQLS